MKYTSLWSGGDGPSVMKSFLLKPSSKSCRFNLMPETLLLTPDGTIHYTLTHQSCITKIGLRGKYKTRWGKCLIVVMIFVFTTNLLLGKDWGDNLPGLPCTWLVLLCMNFWSKWSAFAALRCIRQNIVAPINVVFLFLSFFFPLSLLFSHKGIFYGSEIVHFSLRYQKNKIALFKYIWHTKMVSFN